MKAVSATRSLGGIDRREAIPLLVMVAVWVGAVLWAPAAARSGDVLRFVQIAHGGTPYVDQEIEYPPLETAVVLIVGASSVEGTLILLAIVNGLATAACWLLLRTHWSPDVARLFLWFALPLQVFMPFRIDAVSVLLALGGVALVERDREAMGGGLLGAAVLFKLWPIVIVPLLVVRRRLRALAVTAAVVVGGVVVWTAAFGVDAVRQVASYRGATGWQIESLFGAVVRWTTGDPIRYEAGASRIGQVSGLELLALRGATVFLVALAWSLARRRPVDPAGGPALASVACLLVLSPVASPQYIVWLLPWAAITAAERPSRDVVILTVGAAVTASAVFAVYWGDQYQVTELLILAFARAACVAGLALIGLTHRAATRSPAVREEAARLSPSL